MKKIIALVLILCCVLPLASCSLFGGVSKYKEEVDADEFYEQLADALDIDWNDDEWLTDSVKATLNKKSTLTEVTEYSNGHKNKYKETYSANASMKFDEDNDIIYTESTAKGKDSNDGYKSSYTNKSKVYYVQDGDEMLLLDNIDKTYTVTEDAEDGVHSQAQSAIYSYFETLFEEQISIEVLALEDRTNLDELFDDEDVDVEYYIDGDVYTVVYHEKKVLNKEDLEGYYKNPEKKTTEIDIVIQIKVTDDKISIVREEKEVVTTEYDEYTKTSTEEYSMKGELTFTDSVSVKAPDTAKFADITVKYKDDEE